MNVKYLALAGIVPLLVSGLPGQTNWATAKTAAGPARIYAPYYEAYQPGSLTAVAKQAGVRFVTLAFASAAGRNPANACKLTWDGTGVSLSRSPLKSSVRALAANGGGAIISFGGWTADQGGTEIAESCHRASAIAAAYERVISTYHADRLSMDLEGNYALTDRASISRRDKAIALTQRWAKAHGIPLWIQFTLQVVPSGLSSATLALVHSAVSDHVTINSISLMVFDYYFYDETGPEPMGALAIASAKSVARQLKAIYPGDPSAWIWRMLSFTMMPGIDGYPRKTEVTYLSDARQMMKFAIAKRMNELSIWSLQRDNGACPGTGNSETCSGVAQPTWAFSHLLEPFTS
jgi:Glycosyl hydrolases family 18